MLPERFFGVNLFNSSEVLLQIEQDIGEYMKKSLRKLAGQSDWPKMSHLRRINMMKRHPFPKVFFTIEKVIKESPSW